MGISPKTAFDVEKRPFYATEDGKGKPVSARSSPRAESNRSSDSWRARSCLRAPPAEREARSVETPDSTLMNEFARRSQAVTFVAINELKSATS